MKIEDVFKSNDYRTQIANLKSGTEEVDYKTIDKQVDIKLHDVNDPTERPDRKVYTEKNGAQVLDRIEKVSRVAIPFQKLIVKRAAAFLFGNVPKLTAKTTNQQEIDYFNVLQKVYQAVKIRAHNKRLSRAVMTYKSAAECWYVIDEKNTKYGFDSKGKIKVKIFSHENGDTLFPLFDDNGDMIAFSREYVVKDSTNKEITYFETWTNDKHIVYKMEGGNYTTTVDEANTLGKIPIVYVPQDQTEWADVQPIIERLEKLMSNFGDTNDYHGAPKIFVQGKIKGFSKKGESGAIIEGEKDSKAEYLSWDHAPESIKLEVEKLTWFIYTMTQTPDISFDSVKGLGNISGIALQMLFLDAHLKVEDKKDDYTEALERRNSIVGAILTKLEPKFETAYNSLSIEIEIEPYMPNDRANLITELTTATAGKAIISQKTAIQMSGLVPDAEEEYKLILKEESALNNIGQPSV